MTNIDEIIELLDWNNAPEKQAQGIELARTVKCIKVFLQPVGKNVWENCAFILSEKTDEELCPYLTELLVWLQDLNWPGAVCILQRLRKYKDQETFNIAYSSCMKCAKALKDRNWQRNLKEIYNKNII